jgi:transposase
MARVKTAPIQVQKYLKGMDYPATKEDLIEHARMNKADESVISMLEGLKAKKFNDPAEVSKALGQED